MAALAALVAATTGLFTNTFSFCAATKLCTPKPAELGPEPELLDKNSTPTDFRRWQTRADAGDTRARQVVAGALMRGWGVDKDTGEGVRLIRELAEGGDKDAQKQLGDWYVRGIFMAADQTRAFYWYEKAVAQGDAEAEAMMAEAYVIEGPDFEYSPSKNMEWNKRAVKHGSMQAAVWLCAEYSEGAEKDEKLGISYCRTAQSLGSDWAGIVADALESKKLAAESAK